MSKNIFIVGNGPVSENISAHVDAADYVVRFNEPKASVGMTGVKTSILFINNSDKPMQNRLENEAYWKSDIVNAAEKIVFVYNRAVIKKYVKPINWHRQLRGRRADWTRDAFEAYSNVGKYVRALSLQEYEDGYRELGLSDKDAMKKFPSTGYYGIRYVLREIANDKSQISICGFSFEGWAKHSWSEERHWLEKQKNAYNFKIWP